MPKNKPIPQAAKPPVGKSVWILEDVIPFLEKSHPVHVGLDHNATIECRALYQVKCEQYENILNQLRQMDALSKKNKIENTYEQEPK